MNKEEKLFNVTSDFLFELVLSVCHSRTFCMVHLPINSIPEAIWDLTLHHLLVTKSNSIFKQKRVKRCPHFFLSDTWQRCKIVYDLSSTKCFSCFIFSFQVCSIYNSQKSASSWVTFWLLNGATRNHYREDKRNNFLPSFHLVFLTKERKNACFCVGLV